MIKDKLIQVGNKVHKNDNENILILNLLLKQKIVLTQKIIYAFYK